MTSPNIKPLPFDTYLAMIENAIGSRMFQTGYAEIDGVKTDIMRVGDLSCSLFVSSLLSIFNLIDQPHATVSSTVREMERAGWQKTDELKPGYVLVWAERMQKGESHTHLGFYLGNDEAISNNPEGNMPIKHHYTFGEEERKPVREIMAIYYHPQFMPND